MDDLTRLGIVVDTAQLKAGTTEMGRFAQEGKKADASARTFQGSAVKMGSALGALAGSLVAITGAAMGIGKVISTLAGFEASMSKVAAISGATDAEMVRLRDTARSLGATTEFSASQAADALGFLSMAGFSASESLAAIPSVLDLATASAMGLAETADIASNVMSGFGLEAANMSNVADVLAKASAIANTNVSQLGEAMTYAAPVSKALGYSIEVTAAAIGALSDAGVQGGRAGNSLRTILSKLTMETKNGSEALAEMGLKFSDVDSSANSLSDILHKLAGGNITLAQATKLVGIEGASNLILLTESADKFDRYTKTLEGADGAVKEMAKTMREQLGGDLKTLGSTVEDLILAMGEAGLTKAISTLVQTMSEGFRLAAGAVKVLGENADVLGIGLGILATTKIPAVIASLVTMVTWLGTAEGMFIAGAIAARGMAFAMNLIPGVAFFTALTLGATAVYRAYKEQGTNAKFAAEQQTALNAAMTEYARTASKSARDAALDILKLKAETLRVDLMSYEQTIANMKAMGMTDAMGANMVKLLEKQQAALHEVRTTIGALTREAGATDAIIAEVTTTTDTFGAAVRGVGDAVYSAIPSYVALREEYGNLALVAKEALEAQNALALMDFNRGIKAAGEGLRELSAEFGGSQVVADTLASAMARIAQSSDLSTQSAALKQMATMMASVSGGIEGMGEETRKVYDYLLDASLQAAEMYTIVSNTEGAAGGVAEAVARIAAQFGPSIIAAQRLAAILSGIMGQIGGIAGGLARLAGMGGMMDGAKGIGGAFARMGGAMKDASAGPLKAISERLQFAKAEFGKLGANADSVAKAMKNKFNPDPKKVGGGGGGGGGKGGKSAADEAIEYVKKLELEYKNLNETMGMTEEQQRVYNALQELGNNATDGQIQRVTELIPLMDRLKEKAESLKNATAEMRSTLSSAFVGLVTGAKSLKSAIGDVLSKFAEMLASKAFDMLWKGGGGGFVGSILKAFGFANGGVFTGGSQVKAYADGGVVNGPTMFPMTGGKAGLMGEAGPEAIMPLKRGPNGKLGVETSGGGGGREVSVRVLGGDLKLTDSGQVLASIKIVAAKTADAALVAYDRSVARPRAGMGHG